MAGFRVGELVRLKSGGPVMTVTAAAGDLAVPADMVRCSWFDGGKAQENLFPVKALQRPPAEEPAEDRHARQPKGKPKGG